MAGDKHRSLQAPEMCCSPKIYPKILASVPFQKEIYARRRFKFEDVLDQPVKLLDYYTADETMPQFSLIGVANTEIYHRFARSDYRGYSREKKPETAIWRRGCLRLWTALSKDEAECIKTLKDKINMNSTHKDGYITNYRRYA